MSTDEMTCRSRVSGVLTRTVTTNECHWLDKDLKEGLIVFRYEGCTYGCVTPNGVPVTLERDTYPFVEIPKDAVVWDPCREV